MLIQVKSLLTTLKVDLLKGAIRKMCLNMVKTIA